MNREKLKERNKRENQKPNKQKSRVGNTVDENKNRENQ